MGTPTTINVRAIAKDGKFLGDDIGGALITINDAQTGELLARGITRGGSGIETLMDVSLTRTELLPTDLASVFTASIDLCEPRLIKVTAYGPLAGQGSSNSASITQWVYPGKDITGPAGRTDGLVLEIPGLVVQTIEPPTHFLPAQAPPDIPIRVNVTMMCGCPTGPSGSTWPADQFEVVATIKQSGNTVAELTLQFDQNAPYKAPSQYVGCWTAPASSDEQIYEMVVFAYQQKNGNTGIDRTTFIIPGSRP